MQPSNQYNKRNTIIIIAICLVLAIGLLVYGIARSIIRSKQVEVGIYYAPFFSKVELNDKTFKNNSKIWIDPGEYHLRVSLDHFNTIEETIIIDESTTHLYNVLTPNDEEGERILRNNTSELGIIEAFNSNLAIATGEAQRAEWPIISSLPINNALFSIGYSISIDDHFTLYLNSTETYLNDAVAILKSHAATNDPISSYDILFNQWINPLTNNFTSNNNSTPIEFLRQGYSKLDNLQLTINTGNYSDNYYYTTITTGSEFEYNLVTYRAILKKNNNSWSLISTPQPIVTTYNTPEVPLEILNAANNL